MALDWDAIKIEYITTDTSLQKLADKYGCSKAQIGKVCAQGNWVEDRKQCVADVLTETVEQEVKRQSARLLKLMKATTKAIDVAMEALDDERQFHRYVVTEGIGDGCSLTSEKEFQKVDMKSLKELVGILKELTALARDFDNVPTPAQAEQQRLNQKRLEMEERKLSATVGADDDDEETGVALIPPVLEESENTPSVDSVDSSLGDGA